MVETQSQKARGVQNAATYASAVSRYSMIYSTVFQKLNELTPLVRGYNKK